MPAADMPEPIVPGSEAPRTMGASPTVVDTSADFDPHGGFAEAAATLRNSKALDEAAQYSRSAEEPVPETSDAAAETAHAVLTAPAADPAKAEATPTDAPLTGRDLNQVISRLGELEREKEGHASRAAALEAKLSVAAQDTALLQELRANPLGALKKLGVTQDQLADFMLRGDASPAPAEAARDAKLANLEKQLTEERDARARSEQSRQQAEFTGRIPSMLKERAAELPRLHGYFDSPEELASSVFAVMKNAHEQHKQNLTVLEAATAIEKEIERQEVRISRYKKPAAAPVVEPPKTATPASVTLSNATARTATTPVTQSDSFEPDLAGAATLLKQLRAQLAAQS